MTTMKSRMEEIECDLNDKVSFFEVEEEDRSQSKSIGRQYQRCIVGDFKNVANALYGLFNSLKESKADKSDMAQLETN